MASKSIPLLVKPFKMEDKKIKPGFLSDQLQPAGDQVESALKQRRQKLAQTKISAFPEQSPEET